MAAGIQDARGRPEEVLKFANFPRAQDEGLLNQKPRFTVDDVNDHIVPTMLEAASPPCYTRPIASHSKGRFMKRLGVGLTGASEVIYGIRLLDVLRQSQADPAQGIETHLVLTSVAWVMIAQEINRNGTPYCSAASCPPPCAKMCASCPHCGQM